MQSFTLNFDLGAWSSTGGVWNLSFLTNNPATEIRLEIGEFGAIYPARFKKSQTNAFSY